MLSFLSGQFFALLAFAVVNVVLIIRRNNVNPRAEWAAATTLLAMIVACLAVSFAVLAASRLAMPRLSLLSGTSRKWRPAAGGFCAAVIALLMVTAWLTFWPAPPFEIAFVSCAHGISTICVVWCMRRPRPGYCLDCNFDIRGSTDSGRCPECGRSFYLAHA